MATTDQTQLLYITYFARPGDPTGLRFWTNSQNGPLPVEDVADLFAASPEFQQVNAGKTTDEIINSFYLNLFGRNADVPGLQFWAAEVNANRISIQDVGLRIAQAALSKPPGDSDRIAVTSKITAADRWTALVAASTTSTLKYNSGAAFTYGVDYLATVLTPGTIPSVPATQLAIDALPPVGTVGLLTSNASTVSEGGTVIFTIDTVPNLPAGTTLSYILSGVQSADVLGGVISGNAIVNSQGFATVQVTLLADAFVAEGETLTINVANVVAKPLGGNVVPIIDTTIPPVPALSAIAAPGGVNEGGIATFNISSVNIAPGTQLQWSLPGVNPADVIGATSGTILVGAGGIVPSVQIQIANDFLTENTEVFTFQVTGGGASATALVTIFDTSVAPTQAILTTSQDVSGLNIASPSATGAFTYFANEETLGQSDQLSRPAGSSAQVTLDVGTQGNFNLINFATDGIETLEIRPSNETLANNGFVDLQAALGLRNINVSQSQLNSLRFNDIQSADQFSTRITDSFSTFTYNFDVNALLSNSDVAQIIVEEAPIDATTGEAVGFDFIQGPLDADADIEFINLNSRGSITNVIDQLSVGDDLEGMVIGGLASLDITTDLGLAPNGNRRIRAIDALGLLKTNPFNGNLSLRYTSALGDDFDDQNPDVTIFGAQGNNLLLLDTQSPGFPTDFLVVTNAGDDTVSTVGGDDDINVGEGDNSVVAGDGQNTVSAGAGNDTIASGNGPDLINAGAGDNSISSGGGNDTITTLGGDDIIFAGQGNDSVEAGDGDNQVFGDDAGFGAGNDTIRTGNGADFIVADAFVGGQVEGAGNDSVVSGGGNDTVYAGSGSNTVNTEAGDDIVVLGQTAAGGPIARTPQADTFANTVLLGEGNDRLRIDTDSLNNLDLINGEAGIDTIELFNGGTLLASETLRVSRVEALDLGGFGDYNVTLTDELVRTSDEFVAGSRRFSVLTSGVNEPAGNVLLDLSALTPVDGQGNLLSIRYSGQAEPPAAPVNIEEIIIRDGLISDQTVLEFGEASGERDETFADILQILDSADVTRDDLDNVSGLEVIELASNVNGPQTFTFDFRNFELGEFNRLVGDFNDVLIIRATPLLAGAVSQLTLDVRGADPGISNRILIEQSADLNVTVLADPGFVVPITTALFYTPNADNLQGTGAADTFTAFQLSDVQTADFANGQGGTDTLDLRFAVSNLPATLEAQLSNTNITSIEIFRFNPAAVNQAVRFTGIGAGFATGLQSVFTSGGNDRLEDIERSLFIDTGAGNDTVDIDAAGTVVTGIGNDSVLGSDGNDSIVTGEGDDTVGLGETGGNDFINAGTGNNVVFEDDGNDTVTAANGNNTISTGVGNDSIVTGSGNDSIVAGDGDDRVDAGDGTNTVSAGLGLDSVITGSGADSISTAAGTEVQDDTVRSGAGNDTVLVGLGDDVVDAGADDDLIFLGVALTTDTWFKPDSTPAQFATFTFPVTTTVDGFSVGDRINGGSGVDTVALALADNSITTITSTQFQSIEVFNVAGFRGATLNVSNTLALPSAPLRFNLAWDVISPSLTDSFTFNATSFVQGQSVEVYASDFDNSGGAAGVDTFLFGAGNDLFHESTIFGIQGVIAGNGGADTITLSEGTAGLSATASTILVYNTGNDGGAGGTGTGGDFITGYVAAQDSIRIANGLLTDVGGLLSANVTNSQLVLGSLGDFVGIFQATDTGRNILSLTGPARSLTDAQLSDAAAIANNINGVGVIGNGRNLGDAIGLLTTVTNVTNQALILQQGQTQTALYLYTESSFDFETARAYTVESNELRQLGVFDNALFTGTELVV